MSLLMRTDTVRTQSMPAIRPGTTVDSMVATLADDIVHGRLAPGTPLDEGALGRRFGVSRTPAREALRELNAMGLVQRSPNRRAIVTPLTQKKIREMFEAMAELEASATRLAAERMSVQERRTLADIHRQSHDLVQRGAVKEYKDYNAFFHRLIYIGCHSDYLAELVTTIKYRLAPLRRAQFELPQRLQRSWQEHDRIVSAIMQGDGLGAAEQARAHMAAVGQASTHFAGVDTP